MSAPTVTGTFKHGYKLKVKDQEQVHQDFELRPATTDDVMAAEDDAPSNKPLQYNLALAARQLVRIGTLKGPFTMAMLRRGLPHLADLNALREAQLEADQLGEE